MSENTIIAGALLLGLAAAAAVLPKRSGQKCPVDIIVALPLVAACWFYWELGRWITVRREKKSNIKLIS